MKKSRISSAIPVMDIPTELPSKNLELRLLPYWRGVKHYRINQLDQYISPQDYYWNIVGSRQHPTVANGKIVSFSSRADMYFSRLPANITQKIWRNFGIDKLNLPKEGSNDNYS